MQISFILKKIVLLKLPNAANFVKSFFVFKYNFYLIIWKTINDGEEYQKTW